MNKYILVTVVLGMASVGLYSFINDRPQEEVYIDNEYASQDKEEPLEALDLKMPKAVVVVDTVEALEVKVPEVIADIDDGYYETLLSFKDLEPKEQRFMNRRKSAEKFPYFTRSSVGSLIAFNLGRNENVSDEKYAKDIDQLCKDFCAYKDVVEKNAFDNNILPNQKVVTELEAEDFIKARKDEGHTHKVFGGYVVLDDSFSCYDGKDAKEAKKKYKKNFSTFNHTWHAMTIDLDLSHYDDL